jgi:hypothetical protein
MKSYLLLLLFNCFLFITPIFTDTTKTPSCKKQLITTMFNSQVFSRIVENSGKQMNDLGNFRKCNESN